MAGIPTLHLSLARRCKFESDGVGVDYTPITLAKVEVRPDGDRYLWDVSPYRGIAVFRHPSIWQVESAAQSDLASRIQDILQPFMGLEYPSVEALAGATPLLSRFPEVKRGILRLIEQKRSRGEEKVIPGPFCSQLVALCWPAALCTPGITTGPRVASIRAADRQGPRSRTQCRARHARFGRLGW